MTRVANGDSGAFSSLYDHIAPLVHGTALRVLRDRDHAAEVAQDVLVEVWRAAPRFDPTAGSVTSWVGTIAHRRAVDRVRSVQAERKRDERSAIRDYAPPHDEVAETAEARAEQQQVRSCLGTLTDLQRDALTSTYYEGHTYREAAARSGVALGTMKSRIRDALVRLRTCLEVA